MMRPRHFKLNTRATAYDDSGCELRPRPRTSKIRLIAFILAAMAASAPVGAQSWREYAYPNEGFAVAFPAEPKVKTTSYQVPRGRLVDTRIYSVVQEIFGFLANDLSKGC